MKSWVVAASLVVLAAAPAWGEAYDKSETTAAYTLRLRMPEAAQAIAPLEAEILRRRWPPPSASVRAAALSRSARSAPRPRRRRG
jgi:hypothetical protein